MCIKPGLMMKTYNHGYLVVWGMKIPSWYLPGLESQLKASPGIKI